jgi:hypothetical protein
MQATAPDRDLQSIGSLCAILQATPRQIEDAATTLGIAAAFRINGVVHFSAGQVEALAQHFKAEAAK